MCMHVHTVAIRLVVGIRDAAFSQRLPMDSELTLEKARRPFARSRQFGSRVNCYVEEKLLKTLIKCSLQLGK